jgi:hypothetical protein
MRHNLYVKVADDDLSHQLTLEILQYVHKNLNILKKMEVDLNVVKLTVDELNNPTIQQSLYENGITKLPALTTTQNIYLGNTEIINIYEKNINDYIAATTSTSRQLTSQIDDDDYLDSFMKQQIKMGETNDDEEDINESGSSSLMNDYQRKMEQRKNMMPTAQQPNYSYQQSSQMPQSSQKQQSSQSLQSSQKQQTQANDIEETLKKLQNDIDNNLQMDDEEIERNPHDDVMERALWNRIDLND